MLHWHVALNDYQRERVCKSRVVVVGGVSTGFDPVLKGDLCRRAPFRRDSSPYFCLTLIGYHCQVRTGEVNGGVESTRGHGYMMANLIASLSAR